MSYFSENPEAWDSIVQRGITSKLLSMVPYEDANTLEDWLNDLVTELSNSTDRYARDVLRAMEAFSHDEIQDAMCHYWDDVRGQ